MVSGSFSMDGPVFSRRNRDMKSTDNSYLIQTVSGTPDWSAVPRLQVGYVLWTPDYGIRASGQFCHDADHLYVHLCAVEQDIRAEYTAPLSMVCHDSCLEFFFMPEKEDRYFNFEVNPNGCPYIGFGRSRAERFVLYHQDMQKLFDIRTARTADGWEVFYRIPLSFLRLFFPDFTFTGSLRANVYKCGDLTKQEHFLSWNPVTSETPDFHRPQDFGLMIFA